MNRLEAITLLGENDPMFAQHASHAPVLIECPDRREGDRLEHRLPVRINGQDARTCDVSSKGLSAVLAGPVRVRDVVRVTLPPSPVSGHQVTLPARVAHIQPQGGGCIVGLEFLR